MLGHTYLLSVGQSITDGHWFICLPKAVWQKKLNILTRYGQSWNHDAYFHSNNPVQVARRRMRCSYQLIIKITNIELDVSWQLLEWPKLKNNHNPLICMNFHIAIVIHLHHHHNHPYAGLWSSWSNHNHPWVVLIYNIFIKLSPFTNRAEVLNSIAAAAAACWFRPGVLKIVVTVATT